EPKSVLWKTPKLFTLDPGLTFADRVVLSGAVSARDLVGHDTPYNRALDIITIGKEAHFNYDLSYVIDLHTGKIKNRFRLQSGFSSQPAVAGELLFLGARDGGFYAFDRHDWKAKWEIDKKGYDFVGATPVVANGTIYFGSARMIYEPAGIFGDR